MLQVYHRAGTRSTVDQLIIDFDAPLVFGLAVLETA